MKVRLILVCTLLLLAAVPSFALPQCAECTAWNTCDPVPGAIERCKFDLSGSCYTTFERCSPPRAATVATEWQVVAVDVTRPSTDSITVAAPAPAAEPAPEVLKTDVVAKK